MVCGLVLALCAVTAQADEARALRVAMAEGALGNWDGALGIAEGAIGRDIIAWQRLRGGEGTLGEYEEFLARRPDWPGLPLLRREGEAAVARSDTPERVLQWFAAGQPQTVEGAFALIRAYQATGRAEEATAEAIRSWIALSFNAEQEAALLAAYPNALAAVHATRLDRLLWDGDAAEAQRMLDRVGPDLQRLAQARLALQADGPGVDARVDAVPASLARDPGLLYERFVWRMRKDRYPDAASLIVEASESAQTLGRPEAWADRRALLARRMLRDGETRLAYRIAASHHLVGGSDYADLEFVAGFVALRFLSEAEVALRHFQSLESAVATPISLSRAQYWQGRALEALGRTAEAQAAYARAAEHQTAYYGLLASERAGIPLRASAIGQDALADWQGAAFTRSSVFQAADLLQRAGSAAEAERFLLHLAEGLSPQELAQLGEMALARDEPHLAVLIGKKAAERGVIVPRAYFPVTGLVPDGLPVSRALALSIARRESEFDPHVVSPAGAQGLMQVMPGTASMMADKLGKPYVKARLTSDPAYNAALGGAYLKVLLDEFGPSIALIAAGYNAGPGRPRTWIEQFGDPRRPDVDVVDWVEMIPFAETRTYVMRVAESVVIYRAKLKGAVGPVDLTGELKG